jgi:hypothetical protein
MRLEGCARQGSTATYTPGMEPIPEELRDKRAPAELDQSRAQGFWQYSVENAAGGLRRTFVENRQNLDPITVVTSVKRALIMVVVKAPLKRLQNR